MKYWVLLTLWYKEEKRGCMIFDWWHCSHLYLLCMCHLVWDKMTCRWHADDIEQQLGGQISSECFLSHVNHADSCVSFDIDNNMCRINSGNKFVPLYTLRRMNTLTYKYCTWNWIARGRVDLLRKKYLLRWWGDQWEDFTHEFSLLRMCTSV